MTNKNNKSFFYEPHFKIRSKSARLIIYKRAKPGDGITFDISVDFLLRVQILEALQDFSEDCSNLRFIQCTWFQLEDGVKQSSLWPNHFMLMVYIQVCHIYIWPGWQKPIITEASLKVSVLNFLISSIRPASCRC